MSKSFKVNIQRQSKSSHLVQYTLLTLVFLILAYACYYAYQISNKTAEKFQERVKVVLVHSKRCPYCVKFMPIYNKVASELSGKAAFIDVEVSTDPQAAKYTPHANGYPTVLVYKGEQLMQPPFVGYAPEEKFKGYLSSFV